MNKYLHLITGLFLTFTAGAQQTGNFQTSIQFQSNTRTLEYAVPTDYSAANQYPLVVGLHGCVGGTDMAAGFRDDLDFLVDSIGAIVVCPNGMGGGMMDADHLIILASIDSTVAEYNINPNEVYLTGFSCNGYVTAKYGTQALYPWKGIIPYAAGLINSDFSDGSLDFTNTIPTCICVGSNDGALSINQRFRDSLQANGSPYLYNEIPGVGHTTNFPTWETEIMECFSWIDSGILGYSEFLEAVDILSVSPNPTSGIASFNITEDYVGIVRIYSLNGQLLHEQSILSENDEVNLTSLENSVYLWVLTGSNGNVYSGRLVKSDN